jgi:hypothetical protein
MRRRDPTSTQLKEAFYRLRRQSSVLRDGADRFEGLRWDHQPGMVTRKKDGWELRVYPVDGGAEACLIDPHGNSRTYA